MQDVDPADSGVIEADLVTTDAHSDADAELQDDTAASAAGLQAELTEAK